MQPEAMQILYMNMRHVLLILNIRYYLKQLLQMEIIKEEWKWSLFQDI
ncbi:hypothetical protein GCWU000246_01824 [Jonquetella anthropi E3_33 E1]|nr:hypothetical protein GCWU000246_01824 [Jonquetella anthropi E3_33 E1]